MGLSYDEKKLIEKLEKLVKGNITLGNQQVEIIKGGKKQTITFHAPNQIAADTSTIF